MCRSLPTVSPSDGLPVSLYHILAKHDMVLYKKLSSYCKFHECRLCDRQTALKGVSEPNLYFAHISTDFGEIPYRVSPFNGDR
jgi:hypothetical protein